MSPRNKMLAAFALLTVVVIIGAVGYVFLEGYTYPEAVYMSVLAISTVGFGEVRPLSDGGRIFTTILILTGFVSLAVAGHALIESLFEKVWTDKARIKRMQKKISELKSHYIICGFGRVGAAALEHFIAADSRFVIIEGDPAKCNEMKESGHLYVEGDATRESSLMKAGVKEAKGVLALLDSDPDNLFIVLTARELNPTLHIVARAENQSSEKRILRAGADEVISPFAAAGRQIASDILSATGQACILPEDSRNAQTTPQWIEIDEFEQEQTIKEFSEKSGYQILGLRRDGWDRIMPDPNSGIEPQDMLLILGESKTLANEAAALPPQNKKLVIVDDNRVILRLYNRLFQKAGFSPLTAINGREGIELITKEKPVAAVVDFMLPDLSGADICRLVRKTKDGREMKLIMFTADDDPSTRERGLEAGADEVIIKSPQASEVIDAVLTVLDSE